MSARTRKQKAALAAQSDENETPASNGTAQKSPKRSKSASAEKEVKENVYLFAPNLIGTIPTCPPTQSDDSVSPQC